jgi:hypothetical protein
MADTGLMHRCLTGHHAVSQMCICSIKVHTSGQAAPMVRVVMRGGLIASAQMSVCLKDRSPSRDVTFKYENVILQCVQAWWCLSNDMLHMTAYGFSASS